MKQRKLASRALALLLALLMPAGGSTAASARTPNPAANLDDGAQDVTITSQPSNRKIEFL